jgi:hypothetical protein
MNTARSLVAAAFSLAVIATASSQAKADADPAKERSTAATHAGLAAKSTDLKMTQMHLHHVVNCLVGPNGKGFDATPGNPCKDQGNGAIPDTKDQAQKTKLEQALQKADAGLRQTDMAKAQQDATDAQGLLASK